MSDIGRNHHTWDPMKITGHLANNFRDGLAQRQNEVFSRAADRQSSQLRDDARRAHQEALNLMEQGRVLRNLEDMNRLQRQAVEANLRSEQLTRNANSLSNAARSARERNQDRSSQNQDPENAPSGDGKSPRPLGSVGDWWHWSVYGGWPPIFRTRPNYSDPDRSDKDPDTPDDNEPNWQFETFKARVKDAHREDTGNEMSDEEFEKWLKRNGVAEEGFDLISLASTGAIRGGKAVAKKVAVMAAAFLSGEALDNFKGELAGIVEQYENKVRSQMATGYLGQ